MIMREFWLAGSFSEQPKLGSIQAFCESQGSAA